MIKCKICNAQPDEIFSQSGHTYICKPCMKEHDDTHNDKIGTYPNNYIPSDYYVLIENKKPKLLIDELEEVQKENELNYYGGRA